MKRRVGVVAAVLLAATAAACSSGDDDSGGDGGGDGGGGGLDDLGDGLAAEVAALPLPDDAGDRFVTVAFGDLGRAAELAGVDLPAAYEGGDDERFDAISAVTGVVFDPDDGPPRAGALVPEASHIQEMVSVDEFTDEVGWNIFGVRSFVELQALPDDVTILRGDWDEATLTEAMGEPEDGVWVLGDPGGDLQLADRSAARPLGEPLWLSLDDDRLIVARSEAGMATARGAGGATVGDDPVLVRLAEVLDGADAYSGMLVSGSPGGPARGGRLTPEQAEAACEGALDGPFEGVGVGIVDDDGPVYLIAYVTPDEDAAAATAAAVEELVTEGESLVTGEPWSERLTVDAVDTDGAVALARLRPAEPGPLALWQQLLVQQDNLVAPC